MDLPNDSIGISDLIDHRECGRRFAFSMRRHTEGEPPEKRNPKSSTTAYGSAIHDAIHLVDEELLTEDEAVLEVYKQYKAFLDPPDLDKLKADLGTYRLRDQKNVRTVASEEDLKVPLFVYQGTQIYFRFKLDRLYEQVATPGRFIAIDYKSSAWPRTQQEVDEDLQMWAYNWGIHEMYPECDSLLQIYDQLRFGQIPTKKTSDQRRQMREWLIVAATSVLEDDKLEATWNQWCPWCPIKMDCPEIKRLSDYALAEVAVLAPQRKEGRKTITDLDPDLIEEHLEHRPKVVAAIKLLEKYRDATNDLIKQMPSERRLRYGFDLRPRKGSEFTPDTLRAIHDEVGDDFYAVIGLSKASVERFFKEDPEAIRRITEMADETEGTFTIVERPQED